MKVNGMCFDSKTFNKTADKINPKIGDHSTILTGYNSEGDLIWGIHGVIDFNINKEQS